MAYTSFMHLDCPAIHAMGNVKNCATKSASGHGWTAAMPAARALHRSGQARDPENHSHPGVALHPPLPTLRFPDCARAPPEADPSKRCRADPRIRVLARVSAAHGPLLQGAMERTRTPRGSD